MKNKRRMITTRSNKDFMLIRVDKELFTNFIANAILQIIGIITIVAMFTLVFTLGGMFEAQMASKTAIIVCIICSAWLGIITLICAIIKRKLN